MVLTADAAAGCAALAERVARREGDPRARIAKVRAEACGQLDPDALRFLDALSFALPEDGVLVVDMCIPGYWVGRLSHRARRRAGCRCRSAGARSATPSPPRSAPRSARTVRSSRSPATAASSTRRGELATMAQERIPLTAVIVDDGGYGMLRYDQELSGRPTYGVDLHTPDFAALAQSFGIQAETVEGLDDAFGEALARHVADPEPSVLVAEAPALVAPPNTSPNWYRRA